jgi:hypothetical protein
MKRLVTAAFFLLGLTGVAAACPNVQMAGVQNYYTTGQDLWSPNSYNVIAGGNQQLRNCGFNNTGWVISQPDFEFRLDGLESYNRLNIRVNANCDTVLLVNDATGRWYFNDDGGQGLNASMDIMGARSGVYDIWVGTYHSGTCSATLTLETF